MHKVKILPLVLAVLVGVTFVGLGLAGRQILLLTPPIPEQVVAPNGDVLFTREDIETGRETWRALGGQWPGSVGGPGARPASEWSADWLHRELVFLLDHWARREFGAPYAKLSTERKTALRERLRTQLLDNRFDEDTGEVRVSTDRAEAIRDNQKYYGDLFGGAPELSSLRAGYAWPGNPVPDGRQRRALSAFLFWTAWATTGNRPGETSTYTLNWPHEPRIANVATTEAVMWSVASLVALIGAVGLTRVWRQTSRAAGPLPPPAAIHPLRGAIRAWRVHITVLAFAIAWHAAGFSGAPALGADATPGATLRTTAFVEPPCRAVADPLSGDVRGGAVDDGTVARGRGAPCR